MLLLSALPLPLPLSATLTISQMDRTRTHVWSGGWGAVTKPLYGLIMTQVKSASHLDKETLAKWSKNYKEARELHCTPLPLPAARTS